jgi:hypothetical protein
VRRKRQPYLNSTAILWPFFFAGKATLSPTPPGRVPGFFGSKAEQRNDDVDFAQAVHLDNGFLNQPVS